MTHLRPGSVSVVTGAVSGIGLALAEAFVSRRLKVVLADVDTDRLADVEAELTAAGAEVLVVPTDVARESDVFALAAASLERFGTFDVICNNAGIASDYRPCWEKGTASWERIISTNVWSVVHGIRAFVPHLVAKNAGHVLNIASLAALVMAPAHVGDYAMTKCAVTGLTESLSNDLAIHAPGVKATLLCPGLVRTPLAARQAALREAAGIPAVTPERWAAPLDPSEAAAVALAAIESDLLYAVPARWPLPGIERRFARIAGDITHGVSGLPPTA